MKNLTKLLFALFGVFLSVELYSLPENGVKNVRVRCVINKDMTQFEIGELAKSIVKNNNLICLKKITTSFELKDNHKLSELMYSKLLRFAFIEENFNFLIEIIEFIPRLVLYDKLVVESLSMNRNKGIWLRLAEKGFDPWFVGSKKSKSLIELMLISDKLRELQFLLHTMSSESPTAKEKKYFLSLLEQKKIEIMHLKEMIDD